MRRIMRCCSSHAFHGLILHYRSVDVTTGTRQIAVRQNVCRALFIGRTANVNFAVRFPYDARQTKTHGIYILCRAFLRRRTAITNLLPCVFLRTHGNSCTLTVDRPVGGTRKIRITTLTRGEFSTRSSTRLGRKETVNLPASSTSSKKV
jgi:hypothetical protein